MKDKIIHWGDLDLITNNLCPIRGVEASVSETCTLMKEVTDSKLHDAIRGLKGTLIGEDAVAYLIVKIIPDRV